MGDQFFGKCTSFLRPHIQYIQKLAKKCQVCHKMGVPNFGKVYIIFTSSHTLYLEVGEKIPDMPQNGGSIFWKAYIIFMSSHTIYSEVGEKIPGLPQNGGT